MNFAYLNQFVSNEVQTWPIAVMPSLQAFETFAHAWIIAGYESWLYREYLHLQTARRLRTRMDVAISLASRWTADVTWEDGEAPQHWLHRGDPVLGRYKQHAADVLQLLYVHPGLALATVHEAACQVHGQTILLHPPLAWILWGKLFVSAYFAASPDATENGVMHVMVPWPDVGRELGRFYTSSSQDRPTPPPLLQHGIEYFKPVTNFDPTTFHYIAEDQF
jgi:hypothetical protein